MRTTTLGIMFGLSLAIISVSAEAATCFCKWQASGCFTGTTEVQKDSKGGYIQGLQKEACKNYCRGLFDAPGNAAAVAKKLPNACGNVSLQLFAAIGTAGYEQVRSANINVGGTCETNCSCPPGHWLHSDGKSCVTGTGCKVPGIPNQGLAGGYFFWNGDLFHVTGPANCVQNCKK
jgi:hypothetical protein